MYKPGNVARKWQMWKKCDPDSETLKKSRKNAAVIKASCCFQGMFVELARAKKECLFKDVSKSLGTAVANSGFKMAKT